MTGLGKSIRTRLLNLAKKENISFQLIIIRYMHERLLYRIAVSMHANNFCLKGGVLLYLHSREQTRPTIDIDFLGTNIPNEAESIKIAFREIFSIHYPEDAVSFDINSIEVEEISGQNEYPGIRLFVTAKLDTIRQRIQVDVGFGDIVVPAPVKLSYPTLLPGFSIPIVRAYSLETVIAEKFEAMIDLSVVNSRMKDFYDVYQILSANPLDLKNLEDAISETFRNRNTKFSANHALFSAGFPVDVNRQRQWKAFLTRSHLDQSLDFPKVMEKIHKSLFPIWERLSHGN